MSTEVTPGSESDPINDCAATAHQTENKVNRNFLIYLVTQVLSWSVTFVTLSIIPRTLGESNTGKLVVFATVAMTPFVLALPGAEQYLGKEVGRDHNRAEHLLGALMGFRLAAIVPAMIGVVIVGYCLGARRLEWTLIAISAPTSIFNLFIMGFRSLLAGMERASRVAAIDLLAAWSPLFGVPFLRYGVVVPAVTSLLAAALVVFTQIAVVRQLVRVKPIWDRALWREIVIQGSPFTVTTLLAAAQAFVSVTIVRFTIGDAGVGVAGQVGRLFGTLMFVPTAITSAMLPALARMAHTDAEKFQRTQTRLLALLIVVALPMTTLVVVIAPSLCHLLYGKSKFIDMPLALQTIAFALLPMYIVSTLYQFLVAQGRAMVWTKLLVVSILAYGLVAFASINLCLRYFHNGPMGASIATLVSESLSATLAMRLLRINPFDADLLGRFLRGLLSAGCMAGAMFAALTTIERALPGNGFLMYALQVSVPSAVGLLVFAALAKAWRILAPEDEHKVAQIFGRILGRFAIRSRT